MTRVLHEPFRQCRRRPSMAVPPEPVQDVEPTNAAVRGTHSTLPTWAIWRAMKFPEADPIRMCQKFWSLPSVLQLQGEDLEVYCKALMERYQTCPSGIVPGE